MFGGICSTVMTSEGADGSVVLFLEVFEGLCEILCVIVVDFENCGSVFSRLLENENLLGLSLRMCCCICGELFFVVCCGVEVIVGLAGGGGGGGCFCGGGAVLRVRGRVLGACWEVFLMMSCLIVCGISMIGKLNDFCMAM